MRIPAGYETYSHDLFKYILICRSSGFTYSFILLITFTWELLSLLLSSARAVWHELYESRRVIHCHILSNLYCPSVLAAAAAAGVFNIHRALQNIYKRRTEDPLLSVGICRKEFRKPFSGKQMNVDHSSVLLCAVNKLIPTASSAKQEITNTPVICDSMRTRFTPKKCWVLTHC